MRCELQRTAYGGAPTFMTIYHGHHLLVRMIAFELAGIASQGCPILLEDSSTVK